MKNPVRTGSYGENANRWSSLKKGVVAGGIFIVVSFAVGTLNLGALRADSPDADSSDFVQTNLVSNIPGLAKITDPQLRNPWGVSHSSTSPFWVSNQGASTSTLYAVTDATNVIKVNINPPTGFVAIPTTANGPQGPTGQVNNSNASSFPVNHGGDGGFARFIFANLNGTISAWDGGPTAFVQVTTPGAVYTGLTINGAQTRLYAANAQSGSIDVFNSSFAPLNLAPGAFIDPFLPTGLAPFNVQDITGDIYVTYAPPGRANQISARLGAGAVAIFDEDGNFVKQLIVGSRLAAPWGITLAPPSFGRFGSHLLVGNFSFLHSEINAFDPINGEHRGRLRIDTGGNLSGGLWAIAFGVGGNNGSPDVLYFADGINGERDGLFGAIVPHREAPEHDDRGDSDR
jgi:uncharacterized protein (TIGR03118 family)